MPTLVQRSARLCLLALGALVGPCLVQAAPADATPAAAAKPHDERFAHFDYFVSGDPRLPRAAHTQFGLALMGGGGRVDAAFRFIAERGGHGHMLVLRAVGDNSFDPDDGDYGRAFVSQWGPVASAETLVFRDRDAAFDPRVAAILERADGIFLAGGDQSNYLRFWKGTPVQRLLDAHVAANRPIGGSSAGLAILGHYSYTAADGGSMESRVALADPFDAGVTLEDDFLHYRGLEHVLTDTHFSARHRLGRSLAFLARLHAADAAVVGIGVDEKTALLVDGDGQARLAAGSAGHAWLLLPQPGAAPVRGTPLTLDARIVQLDAGSVLDVNTHVVRKPAADLTLSLRAGRAQGESIATAILTRDKPLAGED